MTTRLFLSSITYCRLVASNVEATASCCCVIKMLCLVYILSWKRVEVLAQVGGLKVLQFLESSMIEVGLSFHLNLTLLMSCLITL